MPPEPSPRPILAAVSRLRRRVRIQRAVRATLVTACVGALGGLVLLALHLTWLLPPETWPVALAVVASALVAAFLGGLLWRIDPLRAAQRLDAASGLHDRLSTALWLLRRGGSPSALEQAQLQDAVAHAPAARPELAAPWVFPRELLVVLAILGGAWALAGWQLPPPTQDAHGLAPVSLVGAGDLGAAIALELAPDPARETALPPEVAAEVDEAVVALEKKLIELEAETDPADGEAQKVLAQMKALLEDLKAQRVDDRTATEELAAVEEAAEALKEPPTPEAQAAAEVTEAALVEAAKALEEALDNTKLSDQAMKEELEKLAEQLQKEEFEAADKTLEELMKKFLSLPKKDQERLAKMFEHLAKKFEDPLRKAMDKLKRERDRLAKKDQEKGGGGLNKKERERLNKLDRQLDQLSKQQSTAQNAEKQRELDRLSRDMKDLADLLKRQKEQEKAEGANAEKQPEQQQKRPDQASPEELKEMIERMKQNKQRQRLGKKMEMRAADLKELMKKRRGQGEKGGEMEKLARGEKEGQERADRKGSEWRKVSEGMKTQWREMKPEGGAGAAKAAMTAGGATELAAETQGSFIEGQKGKGEAFTQVLKGAAQRGTGVKGYGEVHIDYSMRAAEDMRDEEIPPGYRETVEEYFRLIRER